MRIAIDINPVLRNRFSGIWTYGVGLLEGLATLEEAESVAMLCSRRALAGSAEIPTWGQAKFHPAPTGIRLRRWQRWWNLVPWPAVQRWCGEFDVFHSLHHLMPPVRRRPRVLSVYDLRRYRVGELYGHSRVDRFEQAVRSADRLLAISASTRNDLIELLGVDPARVDVALLGTPAGFAPAAPEQRAQTLAWLSATSRRPIGGYAVAIGSPDRRKNLPAAVRAFARAMKELPPDFCLVILGQVPAGSELAEALAAEKLGDRAVATGTLNDVEFRRVLSAGRMLLFLSRYEGFGLPLLEAMSAGTPVIAANNSSMPEIVGSAGRLVEPDDAAAVAGHIVELAHGHDAWSALITAGRARCAEFTWPRTAEQTLDCYRKAIG